MESSLAFFFAQIHLFNSILLQKTNSRNKIELSTKLIIQYYLKTKYKMHELTQNQCVTPRICTDTFKNNHNYIYIYIYIYPGSFIFVFNNLLATKIKKLDGTHAQN